MSRTSIVSFSLDTGLGGRLYSADAFLTTYSALTWHLIATQSLHRCAHAWLALLERALLLLLQLLAFVLLVQARIL